MTTNDLARLAQQTQAVLPQGPLTYNIIKATASKVVANHHNGTADATEAVTYRVMASYRIIDAQRRRYGLQPYISKEKTDGGS